MVKCFEVKDIVDLELAIRCQIHSCKWFGMLDHDFERWMGPLVGVILTLGVGRGSGK